jgi:hypothetical protein
MPAGYPGFAEWRCFTTSMAAGQPNVQSLPLCFWSVGPPYPRRSLFCADPASLSGGIWGSGAFSRI